MGKKYTLTDSQLKQIANLCLQEQGTLLGVKAEASLAANILESSPFYSKVYGSNIYNFMRYSKWFSNAAYYMDNGSVTKIYIDAVRAVLCDGLRTLPEYIDEHDCFRDIISASNYGKPINKNKRDQYIKDVTVITNRYGSIYTFYCFPDKTSDPFGYTKKPKQSTDNDDFILVKVGD